MRFGDFTFPEIAQMAADGWLAVVPTGCTEQQGPHLPVDNDTWFAEAVVLAAAEAAADRYGVNALVLPALPFGPTPEHRGFGSGYVDLPAELHELVIGAVLRSLADQGFGRIVVWRGCGQHDLTGTVERFNEEYAGRCRACVPDFPHHDIWCRVADPSVAGGHADSYTTSILMHLRPDAVRADRIPPPDGVPDDWDDPALDFTAISSSGVVGDATHASAELGERLWAEVVNVVATVLREAAAE